MLPPMPARKRGQKWKLLKAGYLAYILSSLMYSSQEHQEAVEGRAAMNCRAVQIPGADCPVLKNRSASATRASFRVRGLLEKDVTPAMLIPDLPPYVPASELKPKVSALSRPDVIGPHFLPPI